MCAFREAWGQEVVTVKGRKSSKGQLRAWTPREVAGRHREMKGSTKEAHYPLSKVVLGTEERPGFKFCLCPLSRQEGHQQKWYNDASIKKKKKKKSDIRLSHLLVKHRAEPLGQRAGQGPLPGACM